jgi:hypothetical protein
VMIAFDATSNDEAWSANCTVRQVFGDYSPFHQVGVQPDGHNLPGYHAWELWKPISDAELQVLLARCEEYYLKVIE